MQTTNTYNLKKPDYTDFADIQDINDNMDAIDGELAAPTGDLSNATAGTATAATDSYPIPAAGDSIKVILGKIRKFFSDIKSAITGLSISGKTITWTKADGTTGTLETQDTTYSAATTSAAGLMSAADKTKLNGISEGAQVNSVTGIKGNAESSYRTGNVNLTYANVGAAASSHNHSAANITSGTLDVARGGTGQTSLKALRNAAGLGNTTGALPVANGGTGNTSVDTTPTASSTKMCTSGGIKSALARKVGVVAFNTGSKTVSVASSTTTIIASYTATSAGRVIVCGYANFQTNSSTGYRQTGIWKDSTESPSATRTPGSSGVQTLHNVAWTGDVSVGTVLTVRATQTSGSAMNVSAILWGIIFTEG